MKNTAILTGLLLTLIAPLAMADCQLKNNAILCHGPRAAAEAYSAFGFNVAKTNLSHNRQLMAESGCARPFGARYKSVKIEEFSKGKIAMPSGWIPVTGVITDESGIFYVAQNYISGSCERRKPEVIHYKSPYPAQAD